MRNKKGFDKAIEIFVFLFIIMVVGVVVLRMFNAQLTERTQTLSDIVDEELIAQQIMDARAKCSKLCDDAKRAGCTNASMSAFCATNMGPIDVDGDLEYVTWTGVLGGGVEVCESHIFCPLLTSCTCAGTDLTIGNCRDIIDGHLNAAGSSGNANQVYVCGDCDGRPPLAWACS